LSEAQWFETGISQAVKFRNEGLISRGILLPGERPEGDEREAALNELFSIFGCNLKMSAKFIMEPLHCQLLVAIVTVAKLSFWIKKPFQQSLREALNQYRQRDYAQKLKTDITPDFIHSSYHDLVTLLYMQVPHVDE